MLVNGERYRWRSSLTVAVLLSEMGLAGRGGLAVAVNYRVLPREGWAAASLKEEDEIEIVAAVPGG